MTNCVADGISFAGKHSNITALAKHLSCKASLSGILVGKSVKYIHASRENIRNLELQIQSNNFVANLWPEICAVFLY